MSAANFSTYYYLPPVHYRFHEIICNSELMHPEIHILSFTSHTHTTHTPLLSLAAYKPWPYFPSHYPQPGQFASEAVAGNPKTRGEAEAVNLG